MNTRSYSAGAPYWRAAVIVLVFVLSLIAAALPAAQPVDARAPPIPADAFAVVHIRLADIWKSEALNEMRELLLKAGPQALKAFDRRFVPAPSSLDRLTIVVRLPSEPAREPAVVFYLTTSTPFDSEKLVKGTFPASRRQQVGGTRYYVDDKADVGLAIVNEQTIMFGSPGSVQATLEKPSGTGGPLAATLKLASPTTPIVVGVNLATLPAPREQIPAAFAPLLKAQLFTTTVEIGKQARVNLGMQFPDEEAAREGEKTIREGIAMARSALPMARSQLEAMLNGKNKEARSAITELPEAVAGLYCLATIQAYDDLLKEFPLERRAAALQATVELPTGFAMYNPATVGFATGLLVAAVQKVRAAAYRVKDADNLTQIGLAMHMYHDKYGHFPAAAICGKDGKALLSWRVAILPDLDQENLFKQFKLDEPWDSPHNKKLLLMMPKVYALPVRETTTLTHYRVFVGRDAGFQLQQGRRIADITDGLSNTWLAAEAAEGVPWTKPDELAYDPKARLPKLGNYLSGGFNALFMDGSVRFFPQPPDEQTMRALITHAGGEVIQLDP
jgi:prepilin-type processing-associated H-X9-DG protein